MKRFTDMIPLPARTAARLLLLASLSLNAGCADDVTLQPLPANGTILAFGDSITFGTGARPAESYPAILAGLTGYQVVNAGIPGEKTAEGLQRLPGVLDREKPDLVILCLGGNDFLRKVPRQRTKANLDAMLELLTRRGVPVVLMAVPEPTLLLMDSDPLYKELAEQYEVPLENEILSKVLGRPSLKADPIHPNADGYYKVALAINDLLRDAGAVTR